MCFPPQLGYIYRDILTAKCCNNWSLYFHSIWMWSQSLFLHKLSLKPLSHKVHFGAFICYVNVLMRSSFHSKALSCTYQSRFVHVDQNMTVWHLWAQAHWGACPLFLNEPWCSDCLSFFLRITMDWVNVFTGIRWKIKDQAWDFMLSWLPEFFTVYQDVALSNLCWYNSKWYLKKRKRKQPLHLISGLVGKPIPSIYLAKCSCSGWDRWNTLLPSVTSLVMFWEAFNYVRNLRSEKVHHSHWVCFPGLS